MIPEFEVKRDDITALYAAPPEDGIVIRFDQPVLAGERADLDLHPLSNTTTYLRRKPFSVDKNSAFLQRV